MTDPTPPESGAVAEPVGRAPAGRRRRLGRAALFLGSGLLVLVAVELTLRSQNRARWNWLAVPAQAWPLVSDELLGWRCRADFSQRGMRADAAGQAYPVAYSTKQDGFRAYGDPAARRPKVLVLGDSFTQAYEVSDDQTYFAILGRELGWEVFAFGVSGYGSMQQYLALDKFKDRIRPDLILLQLCGNDFINNDLELERGSTRNTSERSRPYLGTDGERFDAAPMRFAGLRRAAIRRSELAYFLHVRWKRIAAGWSGSVEEAIEREGKDHAGFQRSKRTTLAILQRMITRAAGVPVVAFTIGSGAPYHAAWLEVVPAAGMQLCDDVAPALAAATAAKQVIRAADGAHWSPAGHRVAATALGGFLRGVKLGPKR